MHPSAIVAVRPNRRRASRDGVGRGRRAVSICPAGTGDNSRGWSGVPACRDEAQPPVPATGAPAPTGRRRRPGPTPRWGWAPFLAFPGAPSELHPRLFSPGPAGRNNRQSPHPVLLCEVKLRYEARAIRDQRTAIPRNPDRNAFLREENPLRRCVEQRGKMPMPRYLGATG